MEVGWGDKPVGQEVKDINILESYATSAPIKKVLDLVTLKHPWSLIATLRSSHISTFILLLVFVWELGGKKEIYTRF